MKKRKIILMGAPYYGNLGDNAIFYAQQEFIKENLGEDSFFYMPEVCAHRRLDKIKKHCTNEDIIILQGGGNMGNMYIWWEEIRRNVIQAFPNNKIIIFPQTIDFEDTEEGNIELEKTKKIYNNHKNLTILAREEKSYKIMKQIFTNNNVILTPDIVMYLNETKKDSLREGVLLVLRDDKEANLNSKNRDEIKQSCEKYFDKIKNTDTHLGHNRDYVWDNERKKILQDKFDEFRHSELVITDRLHGMIFAAITSTPCIAFDNKNHKIKHSVKWLEKLGYIRYIENLSELENVIKQLKTLGKAEYNKDFTIEPFKKVLDIICE